MARVSFTSQVAELLGALSGSVFQYSYGGYQVHTRVVPGNPQTNWQQLRRGWFGYISALWRTLTAPEKDTWVAAAGTEPGGFLLFVQRNINRQLIELDPITSLPASTQPPPMGMEISGYGSNFIEVVASGGITTVPPGHSLLFFATQEKPGQRIFTNPSEFSPIIIWPASTDLSAPVDVTTEYNARYGIEITGTGQTCIKSVLIHEDSGHRGIESVVCRLANFQMGMYIMDADGTFIIDSDSTFVSYVQ